MKVLLVNGSPHRNGCTDTALREVAGALQAEGIDAEIFWIGNEPVGGCIACGGCAKEGKCVFGGTVNEFAEKAKEADGFVFGTPVHYAAASGNMTAFLDRLFYSAPKETFCRKPAAVVTSARRAGTTELALVEEGGVAMTESHYRIRAPRPALPGSLVPVVLEAELP